MISSTADKGLGYIQGALDNLLSSKGAANQMGSKHIALPVTQKTGLTTLASGQTSHNPAVSSCMDMQLLYNLMG